MRQRRARMLECRCASFDLDPHPPDTGGRNATSSPSVSGVVHPGVLLVARARDARAIRLKRRMRSRQPRARRRRCRAGTAPRARARPAPRDRASRANSRTVTRTRAAAPHPRRIVVGSAVAPSTQTSPPSKILVLPDRRNLFYALDRVTAGARTPPRGAARPRRSRRWCRRGPARPRGGECTITIDGQVSRASSAMRPNEFTASAS